MVNFALICSQNYEMVFRLTDAPGPCVQYAGHLLSQAPREYYEDFVMEKGKTGPKKGSKEAENWEPVFLSTLYA